MTYIDQTHRPDSGTEDHILIERTLRGDTQAFNPLVVKYHPRVYNHILGRVKNTETAKDLTQETFIKAFRGLKSFRFKSTFYVWLYRIAENVCTDAFRKQKKEHGIESLHTIDERRITATHPSACRDMERQELWEILRNAIDDLTPTRKEVFLLYYRAELPIKEIAHRLSKSEGTVKTHLRNARFQLQEYLTPYLTSGDLHLLDTANAN